MLIIQSNETSIIRMLKAAARVGTTTEPDLYQAAELFTCWIQKPAQTDEPCSLPLHPDNKKVVVVTATEVIDRLCQLSHDNLNSDRRKVILLI